MSDLAFDLGTASTKVFSEERGVVLEEPTVAAVDLRTGRLLEFGRQALSLVGATAGLVELVRPVRHGELVDLGLTEAVLERIMRRVTRSRLGRPTVLACVPAGATGIQRRALARSLGHAGARKVDFIEHPVACALAAGLPIADVVASMVVDVGAGKTDASVLALGGVVSRASVALGGDDLDSAIRSHLVRDQNLVVDPETAERIKLAIGCACTGLDELKAEVHGRDSCSGSIRQVVISRSDVLDALDSHLARITNAVVECITSAPPDLADDLLGRGVHLAGGGALLTGLADRLASETGLAVHLVESPAQASVIGAGCCLPSLPFAEAATRR